jgi:hypothetical protein
VQINKEQQHYYTLTSALVAAGSLEPICFYFATVGHRGASIEGCSMLQKTFADGPINMALSQKKNKKVTLMPCNVPFINTGKMTGITDCDQRGVSFIRAHCAPPCRQGDAAKQGRRRPMTIGPSMKKRQDAKYPPSSSVRRPMTIGPSMKKRQDAKYPPSSSVRHEEKTRR